MANTLFLRLEGPLQSWGERARWSVRDTAPEPTKSGVVGLLACASGIYRDDELRSLSGRIRLGVRCDRTGSPLVDYHTIVGGVMSAEGKVKINANTHEPETVVSWRHYLCDASFLVAVQSTDAALIARLAEAVQDPVWPVFLGRRCCPPAWPPFVGVGDFPSLEAALISLPASEPQTDETIRVRAVLECAPSEGVLRRDEVDSHAMRTFLPRHTRDVSLLLTIQHTEA